MQTKQNNTHESIAKPKTTPYRSDKQWIADLSGQNGSQAQVEAYGDLAKYLFVVVQDYLQKRSISIPSLRNADGPHLTTVTEDIVQSCLEKTMRNQHAMLSKYSQKGRFTSWIAQVAINCARSELRKVCWHRNQPIDEYVEYIDHRTVVPEAASQRLALKEALAHCINSLSESHRTVIERCVLRGESASSVAADIGRSTQAVYNLTSRAKQQLQALLAEEGHGPESLFAFADYPISPLATSHLRTCPILRKMG